MPEPRLPGNSPGDPTAVLFAPPVNHGVQVVGPFRKGSAKIAVTDGGKRGHLPARPGDLVFPDFPHRHGVSLVARLLMSQDGSEPPDHPPLDESPDSGEESLLLPACPPGDFRERSQGDRKVSLDLCQKPFILNREFFFFHGSFSILPSDRGMTYSIGENGMASYDSCQKDTEVEKTTPHTERQRRPPKDARNENHIESFL